MPDFAGAVDLGASRRPAAPKPAPAPAGQQVKFFSSDLESKAASIRDLGEMNATAIREMAAEGFGLDKVDALAARVDILLELLFNPQTPQGQASRLEFDWRFEQWVAEQVDRTQRRMDRVKAHVRQVELACGGQLNPAQQQRLMSEVQAIMRGAGEDED